MRFILMQDLDLKDKRVLIREDLNVPIHNGEIADDNRIKAAVPTIEMALQKGARVLCISHLGRPKEGVFDPQFSLEPVAKKLAELLGKPVRLIKDWIDGVELQPGEVAVGENVRFSSAKAPMTPCLLKEWRLCATSLSWTPLPQRTGRRHLPMGSQSLRPLPQLALCSLKKSTP